MDIELLAILSFFTKQKLQNITRTHADIWPQKVAANLS